MALDQDTRRRILKFVQDEPRAVQEIADHIEKAWVTAERYVNKIEAETGELRMKVFREGTRGALKLVYYDATTTTHSDKQRQVTQNSISNARWKEDFDPMRIHCLAKNSTVRTDTPRQQTIHIADCIESATTSVKILTGNFSFLTTTQGHKRAYESLQSRIDDGVSIASLARVNLASVDNITGLDLLQADNVRVRHRYHPLRGVIIDEDHAYLKSVEQEERYSDEELPSTTHLSYHIEDDETISWLSDVFWNMFRVSDDATLRLNAYRDL